MSENRLLQNLVPHHARRLEWKPVEGGRITLSLPNEIVIAIVERVATENTVVARIDGVTMGRGHFYKKNDIVPCRRKVDDFLENEKWEVIPESQLTAADLADRLRREERPTVPVAVPETGIAAPAQQGYDV